MKIIYIFVPKKTYANLAVKILLCWFYEFITIAYT
jgi:hypothetical protein